MYQRRRTGADPSGFRFALAWRAIPLTEFARFAHSDMGSLFFSWWYHFPGRGGWALVRKEKFAIRWCERPFFFRGRLGRTLGGANL